MSAIRLAVAVRIAALLGAVLLSFAAFQQPVRHLEAVAAARVAETLSGAGASVVDSVIVVQPRDHSVFLAFLTPSCSALAAAGSLGLLGAVAPRVSRRRKALAVTAAVTAVVVGNLARLGGSLAAGAWGGRSALVAFHDGFGSLITFGYILGGYVLMLWLLLPAERTPLTHTTVPHG